MRSLFFIFISTVIIGLTHSCRPSNTDAGRILDRADSLMDAHPDSALAILNAIGSDSLAPELRARHALLLSQAYDKNYIDTPDASVIDVALDYYLVTPGHRDLLARSCYYRGVVAFNARDYQLSIHYLSLADTLAASLGDNQLRGFANAMLAWNSTSLLDLRKEYDYTRRSLEFYTLADDSIHMADMKLNVAVCLLQNHNPEEALAMLDSPGCLPSDGARANCLLALGRMDEFLSILTKNHRLLNNSKLMARYAGRLISEGRLTEADTFLVRAFTYAKNSSDSASCDITKAELLKKRGDISGYAEITLRRLSRSYELQRNYQSISQPTGYVEALRSINRMEQEAADRRHRSMAYAGAVAVIIIVMGLSGVIVFLSMRHRHRESLYKLSLAQARLECESAGASAALMKEKNDMLTRQYRLLSESAPHYNPDDLSQETIRQITRKLSDKAGEFFIIPSDDKKRQSDIKAEIASIMTGESKRILEAHVDLISKGLVTTMRVNGVKEKDIEVYVLDRLGMSNNVIALLTGASSEASVASRKTRIHKKIEKLAPGS